MIVSRRSLLRLSWRGLNVSCSVVCNQGGAANAAEIFIVVAGSAKAAAFSCIWLRMLCTIVHGRYNSFIEFLECGAAVKVNC